MPPVKKTEIHKSSIIRWGGDGTTKMPKKHKKIEIYRVTMKFLIKINTFLS